MLPAGPKRDEYNDRANLLVATSSQRLTTAYTERHSGIRHEKHPLALNEGVLETGLPQRGLETYRVGYPVRPSG